MTRDLRDWTGWRCEPDQTKLKKKINKIKVKGKIRKEKRVIKKIIKKNNKDKKKITRISEIGID